MKPRVAIAIQAVIGNRDLVQPPRIDIEGSLMTNTKPIHKCGNHISIKLASIANQRILLFALEPTSAATQKIMPKARNANPNETCHASPYGYRLPIAYGPVGVKDIDFKSNLLIIRSVKGEKDIATVMSQKLM